MRTDNLPDWVEQALEDPGTQIEDAQISYNSDGFRFVDLKLAIPPGMEKRVNEARAQQADLIRQEAEQYRPSPPNVNRLGALVASAGGIGFEGIPIEPREYVTPFDDWYEPPERPLRVNPRPKTMRERIKADLAKGLSRLGRQPAGAVDITPQGAEIPNFILTAIIEGAAKLLLMETENSDINRMFRVRLDFAIGHSWFFERGLNPKEAMKTKEDKPADLPPAQTRDLIFD